MKKLDWLWTEAEQEQLRERIEERTRMAPIGRSVRGLVVAAQAAAAAAAASS